MNEINIKQLVKEHLGKRAKYISTIIGGMMNHSYIYELDGRKYIVYIPSESGKEMIVRSLEKENVKIMNNLGVTSTNVYFDELTGCKINEYVDGNSLDKVELTEKDIKEVCKLLKIIHKSPILSRSDYPLFESIYAYEDKLFSLTSEVNKDYIELKTIVTSNKDYLLSFKKCLCHNDSQRSNFIKSNDDKYYIIDFEFAMNNDPLYDIAAFANNKLEDGEKLLAFYYKNPTKDHYKRFYLWRIYISLQWYLVAQLKHFKDGDSLGIDFIKVSEFFINLAIEAKQKLLQISQLD